MIYCVGGYLRLSLDTVEALYVDDGSWTPCANLPVPRSGLGVVFVKVRLSYKMSASYLHVRAISPLPFGPFSIFNLILLLLMQSVPMNFIIK